MEVEERQRSSVGIATEGRSEKIKQEGVVKEVKGEDISTLPGVPDDALVWEQLPYNPLKLKIIKKGEGSR